MKKLFGFLVVLSMLFVLSACDVPTPLAVDAEKQQSKETKRILSEVNNQIGMPDITNFYEKKMAKEIFELRDDSSLVTYAYTQNLEGRYVYLGQCIGFGLPYSVQYTNPQKVEKVKVDIVGSVNDEEQAVIVPQADPNGLYMPEGLSATWIMWMNPVTKKNEIIYMESEITVTQSKLPKRLIAPWSLPDNY